MSLVSAQFQNLYSDFWDGDPSSTIEAELVTLHDTVYNAKDSTERMANMRAIVKRIDEHVANLKTLIKRLERERYKLPSMYANKRARSIARREMDLFAEHIIQVLASLSVVNYQFKVLLD